MATTPRSTHVDPGSPSEVVGETVSRARGRRGQRGMALVLSLILMLVMTLIAMSTLFGSRSEQQIVTNTQQKAQTYEIAESAIETVWTYTTLNDVMFGSSATDEDEPGPIAVPLSIVSIDEDFDQNVSGTELDFSGTVEMQYCGEASIRGGNLDVNLAAASLGTALVDVTSDVTLRGTDARSVHVRRGGLMSIKTGRGGACAAR